LRGWRKENWNKVGSVVRIGGGIRVSVGVITGERVGLMAGTKTREEN